MFKLTFGTLVVSLSLGGTHEARTDGAELAVEAKLHSITELRQLDIVPPDENQMFMFDKPGLKLDSGMSMWTDSSVTYMFEGAFKPSITLRLKLRRGLERSTITINLDDQPLP